MSMEGTRVWLLVAFLIFGSALSGYADQVNNEWYSTTNALTRGNTGIAYAGDPATAMFYNPALLGSVRRANLDFLNPQIEMGGGNFSLISSATDFIKLAKLSKMVELHQQTRNIPASSHFSIYPNLYAKNFSVGFLYKVQTVSYMDEEGTLFYKSEYILMPTVGLSVGLFNGIIKIGGALRGVQIAENDRSTTDFNGIGYDVGTREGFGLGIDAGIVLTFPWVTLPRFAATLRNAGGTDFTGSVPFSIVTNSSVEHETEEQTIDAGFAMQPLLGRRTRMLIAADWRDVTDVTGAAFQRKLNLGLELDFVRVFRIKVGRSRGYWTAGIGLGGKRGSLDFGTYAEELDATKLHSKRDRRWSLRLGKRF